MEEEILTLAAALSGAAETEQPLLELLCRAALEAWRKRLRSDVSEETCREALLAASAFCAAADLDMSRGGETWTAFTAGEVSVSARPAAQSALRARGLRQAAEELMRPYTMEDEVWLMGVRGS